MWKLKPRLSIAVQQANEILKLTESDPDWSPMAPATSLRLATQAAEAWKSKNDFWKQWYIGEMAAAKKDFADALLLQEGAREPELRNDIGQVEVEMACLKSFHDHRKQKLAAAAAGDEAPKKKMRKAKKSAGP